MKILLIKNLLTLKRIFIEPSKKYLFLFFVLYQSFLGTILYSNPSLEKAVQAYDQGKYSEAVEIFEFLRNENPNNGHILYNLASSYYRLNEIGKSVAALLAARKLLPRDSDLSQNLEYIQERTSDHLRINKENSLLLNFVFWKDFISLKELSYSFACCFAFTILLIILSNLNLYVKNIKTTIYFFSSISFLFLFMTSTSFWTDEDWGAVIAKESQVYSGPGKFNTVLFTLHEGAPFLLEKEQKDWYQIQVSDGKRGWMMKNELKIF